MKIDLKPEERNAIEKLMGVGGVGVEALKELFEKADRQLSDVRNIDSKGNMGLQSLAAQKALDILDEIKEVVFPSVTSAKLEGEEKQPVRTYR